MFKIEGPAAISFSGGRTSGLLLWKILEAHGGELPKDVVVAFANTGLEHESTLHFIRECESRWNVPITWLEHRTEKPYFSVVDFESASRRGEPFEALIDKRKYLPNPVARFCTQELKIRTMSYWIRASLGWDHWDYIIGLRADEPRRVARLSKPTKERWERFAPLARAGIVKEDVLSFWRRQPFDLELPNNDEALGNCVGCFLKGKDRLLRAMRAEPEHFDWWERQERKFQSSSGGDATFRRDRPNYAALRVLSRSTTKVCDVDDTTIPCTCTD